MGEELVTAGKNSVCGDRRKADDCWGNVRFVEKGDEPMTVGENFSQWWWERSYECGMVSKVCTACKPHLYQQGTLHTVGLVVVHVEADVHLHLCLSISQLHNGHLANTQQGETVIHHTGEHFTMGTWQIHNKRKQLFTTQENTSQWAPDKYTARGNSYSPHTRTLHNGHLANTQQEETVIHHTGEHFTMSTWQIHSKRKQLFTTQENTSQWAPDKYTARGNSYSPHRRTLHNGHLANTQQEETVIHHTGEHFISLFFWNLTH